MTKVEFALSDRLARKAERVRASELAPMSMEEIQEVVDEVRHERRSKQLRSIK